MLIINADDWGTNESVTDKTLSCFKKDRITSASALMFMADSERSAQLALENDLDMGLHLNFTQEFSGNVSSSRLTEYHRDIVAFLSKNKYYFLLYNPLLRKQFEYVYKARYEEYMRLYKKVPTHIDGHHHMQLCTNVLLDRIIPEGFGVRRNFSFAPGEKSFFNRFYRNMVDTWLMRYYSCIDFFFDIMPLIPERLRRILKLAKSSNVELMVHPTNREEYNYLMSEEFWDMISGVEKGTYCNL